MLKRDHIAKNFEHLRATMALLNVTKILVEYSGYGDSGQVEDVNMNGNTNAKLTPIKQWHYSNEFDQEHGGFRSIIKETEMSMEDAVVELALETAHGYDIVNNEGGGLTWELKGDKLDFRVHQNVTETQTCNEYFGPVSEYISRET